MLWKGWSDVVGLWPTLIYVSCQCPQGPIVRLSWQKIVWLILRPNRWAAQLTDIVSQTLALIVRDGARNRYGENVGRRMDGKKHFDFYCEEIWGEFHENEFFTRRHSIQCLSPQPSILMIFVLRIIWWQEEEAHSNDLGWAWICYKNIGQSHQT